jgi:uncharacterized membrane protein YbhN (UPF0104 family)
MLAWCRRSTSAPDAASAAPDRFRLSRSSTATLSRCSSCSSCSAPNFGRLAVGERDVAVSVMAAEVHRDATDGLETALSDQLNPRRLWRRLLEFALAAGVIGTVVLAVPSLSALRRQISNASGGWLLAGAMLETLSALSYVVLFREVFCSRMTWRLSYQIGMAEQGANSVMSVSGAGGLALGAWALRRGGMETEPIARRTVAFFFLTSFANVAALIAFAVLYATGVLHGDRNPPLTYGFGAAAALTTGVVALGLPRLQPTAGLRDPGAGRLAQGVWFIRNSLGQGVRDALAMLRSRTVGIVLGSFGTMTFDLAVLGVSFSAFGYSPPVGILVIGYLVGQLGGNLPLPGGIGGVDAGLIGTFAAYHQPLVATTAAVLVYHAIALWIPGLLGTVAFVQLRRTLQREQHPAAICMPLVEPILAPDL